jgi:hypothetical protein
VSTAVHGAQVVEGMQKNHTTRVKRPLGLWSRPRISLAYGPFGGTSSVHVLDCPCPGMVLTVCSRAHYVTPRSVQLTQNRTGATEATMRTNTNRQRSKLAEASQEGERGDKTLLISLRFRTKQVIKVMRANDKGGKKIGSNKYK